MEAIKDFLKVESGSGYGSGYGISKFNGSDVYQIDGVSTVIASLHGNVAKGFALNSDLTQMPCYVVKGRNCFAHGETLHEAQQALQEKIFEDMDEDERIEMFLREFDLGKKYPAAMFFDWHNKLTGSCKMGREMFCRNHNIDVSTADFTVSEFIELAENDFGGDIIRKLKERT